MPLVTIVQSQKLFKTVALTGMFASIWLPASASQLDCSAIANSSERLKCYDTHFLPQIKDAPVSSTKWSINSRPSRLTDKMNRSVAITSINEVQCRWNKGSSVQLQIQCLDNVTSISFRTGCYMASSAYESYGDVTYQIDDAVQNTIPMVSGEDNRSLGLWSGDTAIPFIRAMSEGTKLVVKMTPFSEAPIIASFDVRNIDNAITTVREECGW